MKGAMALFAGALLITALAGATTISFPTALPLGNLPQSISIDGLTISAWAVSKTDGTAWSNSAILNNRDEVPTDVGLGACQSASNCPAAGLGSGYFNEINNNGTMFGVVRINTAGTAGIASIDLASVDDPADDFAIFGSNTALPNLSLMTPLASGTEASMGTASPIVSVPAYQYYFVTTLTRSPGSDDSNILVNAISMKDPITPEPVTSGLIGFGLAAIAGWRVRSSFSRKLPLR